MQKSHSKNHFKQLKTVVLTLAIFIASIAGLNLANLGFNAQPVSAANPLCSQPGVSDEVLRANGCKTDAPALDKVVVNIVNAIVGVLGLVAVVFIIVGGVNYMTSGGDSGKLQKAKSTILYAVIGLVIAVLAFAIVNFVIGTILEQ